METSYIFQRISVALQRGNAICISGTLPPLCKEFGGAPKRPVSNGPAKAPSAVLLNPPPVTSAVGHRKQPGLIAQTAITAARIAAGSAVGHTAGAAISVGGGYSDTAPAASQAEKMHQNADSKEPDEQILETSLQSETESDSTQGDDQTTTTTSVPSADPQPFQHFHMLVFQEVRGGFFRRSDDRKTVLNKTPKDAVETMRIWRNKADVTTPDEVIAASLNDVEKHKLI